MTNTEDTYGPDLTGTFQRVPVEELQGGDIIPSHDGLYHTIEGHAERGNVVEVNLRRGRINGQGGEAYSVEFERGAEISILL